MNLKRLGCLFFGLPLRSTEAMNRHRLFLSNFDASMTRERSTQIQQALDELDEQIQAAFQTGNDNQELYESRWMLEVELAKLQEKPYGEMLDLGLIAEPNVATPLIFGKENALAVGFLLRSWEPGRLAKEIEQSDAHDLYGLIKMQHASAWRVDATGDDAQPQHPSLQFAGRTFSFAHIIHQSEWLADCMNRRQPQQNHLSPINEKHLILEFHDGLIEIITRAWSCEVVSNEKLLLPKMTEWISSH